MYTVRYVGYKKHLTTVHLTLDLAQEHIMSIIRNDMEKFEFYRYLPAFAGLRLAVLANDVKQALKYWNSTSLEEIELIVPKVEVGV